MGGNYKQRERKTTGICKRCNGTVYSSVSIEDGLYGMCLRDLRERGLSPRGIRRWRGV